MRHAGVRGHVLDPCRKEHRWRVRWSLCGAAGRLRCRLVRAAQDALRDVEQNEPAAPRCRGAVRPGYVSGRRRFLVNALAQRHRIQLGVRGLLLVQVGRQETHDLIVA